MSYIKGYKAFNKTDKTNQGECRGVVFNEGEIHTLDGCPVLCKNGYHFCKDLVLTFKYYGSDLDRYVFAEVEALGEVVYESPTKHKACTNKIKIVRFLKKSEIESMLDDNSNSGNSNSGHSNSGNSNSGHSNSGDYNTGNYNSGNYNSGSYNSGDHNSGDYNSGKSNSGNFSSGHFNTGNSNSGNFNSGEFNSGDYNSGDYNSGRYNSGSWNKSDRETGYFNNHLVATINVFNKPCSLKDWNHASKPDFIYFKVGEHYKLSFIESFNKTTKEDVLLLLNLPNFDYNVFEDISGISKEMIENKLKGE